MTVSIMITTRNRCEDLIKTLNILAQLEPTPFEILVTADGCTDDTVKNVRGYYPKVSLSINPSCLGSVVSRDRMIRRAKSEIVLSLDDDSHPVKTDFLSFLTASFKAHPDAAVMCFPELRNDGTYWPNTLTSDSKGMFVAAYANGAAAMRRDVYLKTKGFPHIFFHAYEEPDYAAQCHGLGYGVWLEPSLIIRHRVSELNRNPVQNAALNARNEFWSVLMRCPWPWLPLVAAFRAVRQFQYAWKKGWPWLASQPSWWLEAAMGIPECFAQRQPTTWRRYLAWMKLARHPISENAVWRQEMGI